VERTELSAQSTTELVRRASEQVGSLVRSELQLARAELAEKGKRAGVGAGLLGTAGVLALYGLAALFVTIGVALALVVPAWAAALIVTALLFAAAVVLALLGRASLKKGLPPVPERAVASVKADIDAVTTAVAERGHAPEDPVTMDRTKPAGAGLHTGNVAPEHNGHSTNGAKP
jgi:uncharacterized membrane protein YqjE